MFNIVIPARFGSTRLPGKALLPIADKPMVAWVWERAMQAGGAQVVVATDDQRIADEMTSRGAQVAMTRADHASGTDRLAEVVEQLGWEENTIVVNVQGDEPLIAPEVIDAVAGALSEAEMTTAATPVNNISDYSDANVVKVVVSATGRALYFSRSTIPFVRDLAEESPEQQLQAFPFLKHLGIYGYRCEALRRLVEFPPSPLEQTERLEQLRALENGIEIAVCPVEYEAIGVDVPEDVQRVEALLSR